ncbi:unnamed protein product [Toxocara canis]|uniref:Uncharacterized protein n=1 Tax=Toxocara canis TaxID=6265 RepID=A0A183UTG2_TOXCA|nr:unnamed protein product [Toxocara canis]
MMKRWHVGCGGVCVLGDEPVAFLILGRWLCQPGGSCTLLENTVWSEQCVCVQGEKAADESMIEVIRHTSGYSGSPQQASKLDPTIFMDTSPLFPQSIYAPTPASRSVEMMVAAADALRQLPSTSTEQDSKVKVKRPNKKDKPGSEQLLEITLNLVDSIRRIFHVDLFFPQLSSYSYDGSTESIGLVQNMGKKRRVAAKCRRHDAHEKAPMWKRPLQRPQRPQLQIDAQQQ